MYLSCYIHAYCLARAFPYYHISHLPQNGTPGWIDLIKRRMDAEGILEGHVQVAFGVIVFDEVRQLRLRCDRNHFLRACLGIDIDEISFRVGCVGGIPGRE